MIDPDIAMIEPENAMIDPDNAMIDKSNLWDHAKNLWIDHVNKLYDKGVMTAITSSSIIAILEDLQEDQVIGTKDVQKVLDCKDTKARRILSEMKKTKIIIAITGQGKGKYTLNIL